jgi:hypothetical protein
VADFDRILRRISEFEDQVADGAVWIEPFSVANSLINRETTGNFLNFRLDPGD